MIVGWRGRKGVRIFMREERYGVKDDVDNVHKGIVESEIRCSGLLIEMYDSRRLFFTMQPC